MHVIDFEFSLYTKNVFNSVPTNAIVRKEIPTVNSSHNSVSPTWLTKYNLVILLA